MQRLILPLPGNEASAARLAAACGGELGAVETRRFPDGESYVRLHGDPRARAVDVVCTLAHPDPAFLSLVFVADTARDLGAAEVNLVAPYLAYMRQDKRFLPGESISSRSFARLISSTFDRLITVDPHLHRHPTLASLYRIPAATLHAAPLLGDWIAANVQAPLIIGPDEESEQWAGSIAARIGAPHVVLRKIRHGDRQVEIETPDLGAWRERTPVLVDDIASSGRTLVAAAGKLAGMKPPQCVVVHALFAEDAWSQVSGCFERVVSTDAVPHPSNRIELAPLLAGALLRG
ncbi:ribose-phosphate pyrophosphokinase [Bordetella hinzii]|uniref:Phosphoribosylpyrophosphate synthetase n=2 Tax=Bordetella hinzii TaxID=103855 RepID=A0AAN1RWS0_9BORD|nr:ribose-phosphate pyrophosphokinase [Bordetella hinzii]AKQ61789.1 Ribose-phosphate pyrophosphokinase [Bordetella hinzii]AZW17270.1 phosphoribosylpyrophosphate synthetase [Bordetella hinzii]KCB22903.1 ribose-phosphate diphosphokinase [Bordetella hinzii OH87 BAL007II]KCB30142.1 ribose-phosphate diphosphokinase [Bordetella hinzii CA90 BAL1384]KCB45157.1 ribose-phosphate diphosphokinase [Bordetella hinzii 4161]